MSKNDGGAVKEITIIGQSDTSNNYMEFTHPVRVARFGQTLRDCETGEVWASKDGSLWLSSHMLKLGLRCILNVKEKYI